MALITLPARLHAAARTTNTVSSTDRESLPAALLAFVKHVGRRLADAPLDSTVLQARPAPRTQDRMTARHVARSAAAAHVRGRIAGVPELRQYWLPLAGPDGKVRLVAHWSPRT